MLVEARELRALLADEVKRPAVLDVRWTLGGPPGGAQYLEAHIPTAVFVDLDTELAGPPGAGGRHPVPSTARFGAAMRRAGVRGEHPVVVYDAASSLAAARAWWLLRYFGHPDVLVLNGGFAAWVRAGYPVEDSVPVPAEGDFEPWPGAMPVLDAAAAGTLARSGVLLDARAPERFRGELEPIDGVAGHIPGARNLPATELLEASGRFRGVDELRAAFEAADVRHEVAVGAYCGSGVTAAHLVLALELAGYAPALYPGSWSEWITDPRRPVETG